MSESSDKGLSVYQIIIISLLSGIVNGLLIFCFTFNTSMFFGPSVAVSLLISSLMLIPIIAIYKKNADYQSFAITSLMIWLGTAAVLLFIFKPMEITVLRAVGFGFFFSLLLNLAVLLVFRLKNRN